MPITNPALSVQVAGYVKPTFKMRMKRIRKAKPRYSFSSQIERCLEVGLPVLEREAGVAALAPLTQK